MTSQQASEFIENNEDALRLLAEKVKNLTHVDEIDETEESIVLELKARKHAKRLITEWISELFSLKNGEFNRLAPEEDNIFNVISKQESSFDE